MTEIENIHQLNEAQEAQITQQGKDNEVRKQKAALKRGDLSGTKAGMNTSQKLRDRVEAKILEYIETTKQSKAKVKPVWFREIEQNPTEVTAELTLRVCLDAVGAGWGRTQTVLAIADAINASILNFHLRNTPEGRDLLKGIDATNKENGGSTYTMRQRAMYIASKQKMRIKTDKKGKAVLDDEGNTQIEPDPTVYSWSEWSDTTRAKVGGKCYSALLESCPDVFVEVTEKEEWSDKNVKAALRLTPEAEEALLSELEHLSNQSPMHAPMFDVPQDWGVKSVGPYNTLSLNMLTPIVKNMGPEQDKAINEAMLNGDLNEAMAALNSLQRVGYSVNRLVLEAVKWTRDQIVASKGEIKVESFPHITKVEAPEKPAEGETDQNVLQGFYSDAKDTKKLNGEVTPNKLALSRRLAEADNLIKHDITDRFYLPHNWDSRGRVYHLSDFGFQNTDYLRGMFMFADKGKVTKHNEHHLKIHTATMWGNKVDKMAFEGRLAWFEENKAQILELGEDNNYQKPELFAWWRTADEPFQFLAACREVYNYEQEGEGYLSGLPIQKDASCSGIQFYSMAGRNKEDGEKVNLTNNEAPDDLYDHVRVATLRLITQKRDELEALKAESTLDEEQEKDLLLATQWLAHGVTRSVCKGPTMTWAYSSEIYGFQREIKRKLMKDLTDDVRKGRIAEHPFGPDKGSAAAWFFAKIVIQAIRDTVQGAADGMDYLQKMAKLCLANNMHLHFVTPLNFPSFAYYRDYKDDPRRIAMPLWDQGATKERTDKLNLRDYIDGSIHKTESVNASAPNFIHALDATLLMKAVNRSRERGVTNMMCVHDSFATTINNVDTMVDALLESLVDLFDGYCPYDALMQQTMQRIANQIELPKFGDLDLAEVRKAPYAFS